jgi:predicted permease
LALFFSILMNSILPAYLVVGCGFLLERTLHLDKRTLSRLAIYFLTPALVFTSLMNTEVSPLQMGSILLAVALVTFAMIGLALGVGRLLRWPSREVDGLVLSVAFINAGNLGLSVALFAFGEAGLELATIYYVGTNLAVNTLGAFFAARGNGGARKALFKLLRLPGLYAFVLAILLRIMHWQPPALLMKPVELASRATVPIMLIMLGVQLAQTRIAARIKDVSLAVGLRLVGGALAGFAVAPLLGLGGLARDVVIMQSATPTAVNSSMMAIEFDADPDFVSCAILASTLLSSITLAILLAVLA